MINRALIFPKLHLIAVNDLPGDFKKKLVEECLTYVGVKLYRFFVIDGFT